jgi:hypothetical protein
MRNRNQPLSVLIVSTLAFTVCFMAWMMFAVMYWTEVRGAELMGIRAKPFRLHGKQEGLKQGTS